MSRAANKRVKWDAAMDQRFLLAVLAVVKLDVGAAASKFKEFFGVDKPSKALVTVADSARE